MQPEICFDHIGKSERGHESIKIIVTTQLHGSFDTGNWQKIFEKAGPFRQVVVLRQRVDYITRPETLTFHPDTRSAVAKSIAVRQV